MRKKNILFLVLLTVSGLLVISNVKADDIEKNVNYDEYTEEYKDWLTLTDEEKQACIEPAMYAVPESTYISSNPLKLARMTTNELEATYDLRNVITENLVIRDQKTTSACWAFAIIASLETNLALKDLTNNAETKSYDFSEMHMEYATVRNFLNGEVNPKGFNKVLFTGGTMNRGMSYLTNGSGAIDESSMPIDKYCKTCITLENNKVPIDTILNKTVTTQVNDTIEFPSYRISDNDEEKLEKIKSQFKNHIKNYGGVVIFINFPNILSKYFNYDNSAIYCDNKNNCPIDHTVTIVGWDDNYDVTNFGSIDVSEEERIRPSSPGAWLVKNSYGVGKTYTFEYFRESYCSVSRLKTECEENGWDEDSTLIPDEKVNEFIEYNKYSSNGDGTYTQKKGEDGFYYVSYEDANVYIEAAGIVDASTDITYDNIYQYNDLGWNYNRYFETDSSKIYLAEAFKKNNPERKEYLTQISMFVPETNTVSVYVNPNGSDLDKENLQLVQLKAGQAETFDAGYHTLEFLNPIELTGKEFAVVLEIKKEDSTDVLVRLEGYNYGYFEIPGIANGAGFYSTDMTNWQSFSNYVLNDTEAQTNANFIGADTTIKAFTISEIESIEIVTPPDKTTYIEGDKFETLGMKVEAISENGTRIEITDYTVENGSILELGQETVTISYLGKTEYQEIIVEKNIVEKIEITKAPTLIEYIEGQNFNSDGMFVRDYYKNGTSVEINNYKVIDGDNLIPNKQNVTINYEEDGVNLVITQSITVREKTLQSIILNDDNVKKSYIEGQNFDKTGLMVTANYEYLNIELKDNEYEIIGGENLQIGSNDIIIKYKQNDISKEAIIKVEAIKKEIVSISIYESPDKIDYIEGQTFDSKGMVVKAKFNDGDEKDVTEYISIENCTNLIIGQENVIIKYQGKEVSQAITVVAKQIESISIKELPIKKTYIQNKEELNLTGGIIMVSYDNGSSEIIDMDSNSVVVTGYDNTKIGTNNLLLTYGGKELNFSVEIKEEVIPINSNFENAIGNVNSIKAYYYTTEDKQNYVVMQTVISDILKSKVNEKMEYYYYLSPNQEELNIENWVKIKEEQNIESDILSFVINTKDITNYDEVSTSDVLYLYIKEVATRENKQQTLISNALLLEANVEIEEYVDDVKYEGNKGSNDDITENPETGSFVFLFIVMIIGTISLGYVRYYFDKQKIA